MLNRPHKILVVDDEPISLKLLARALSNDYNTITAESGQEALEILKRETVALLITDQNMPGMTGLELLRLSRGLCPDTVCMLMSAVDDTSVFIDAIANADAIRVLKKPWNREKLLSDVQASIKLHESFVNNRQSIDRLNQSVEAMRRAVEEAANKIHFEPMNAECR